MLAKLQALKNHQGFVRYFKNTSWMMAEQFLRIIAGLFVGIWVARYLGPEQFGLFSYVLAFTAIFGGVAKLGLDGIMVRELVNHPEKRDTYLGTAFWLKVIGALIVMSLMAAIVPFTSNDATTNTFIFIIAAGLIFQSFEVVEFYFQSQVMAKIVSICKVIQLALSSTIKIYLVLTEAELIWFVLVTAFDALSLAISYFIAYQLRKNLNFYNQFDFRIAKQLLKDSWPMIFAGIAVAVYMKIDQVMIQGILGSHATGIYSSAVKLVEAFLFITVVITKSLAPNISKVKKSNLELYEARLIYLLRFLFYLAVGISILLCLISHSLVSVLYGDQFKDAGNILSLYAFSIIFVFLNNGSWQWFINENEQVHASYKLAIGALINIVLNYFWIEEFGIIGAVYSTLVSYFMAAFLLNLFFLKTKKLFLLQCKAIFFIDLVPKKKRDKFL